jgi:hypothetical protein
VPDVPLSDAVSALMSALAVAEPAKSGSCSTAATVVNGPPLTETANEIGWSPDEKSVKDPLAVVHVADTT